MQHKIFFHGWYIPSWQPLQVWHITMLTDQIQGPVFVRFEILLNLN